MSDSNKPPHPPEFHGTPLVSAKLVPFFGVGAALCAALVAGAEMGLDLGVPHLKGWAIVGGIFFAALLGTTPGARKP